MSIAQLASAPSKGRRSKRPRRRSAEPKVRRLVRAAHDKIFRKVHGGRLIYNTSWEDPRLDRELMDIDADSKIVVITSAGCNVLDYLLDGPASIDAVDVNYRQNALMELKLAMIRRCEHEDFFKMFGDGRHEEYRGVYRQARDLLPTYARGFWDRRIKYFDPKGIRKSFYYHGTAGEIAWVLRKVLTTFRPATRPMFELMLGAQSLDEQKRIYSKLEPELWNRLVAWLVRRPSTMTMMGVPRAQVKLIDDNYPGGLGGFVRDKLRRTLTEVPTSDNYFWRIYSMGSYTPECCPNYLKAEHFPALRERAERVQTHTCTMTHFLAENPGKYTHFVLLDHQDWLAGHDPEGLVEEWEHILANAAPKAKVLMRSAGINMDFLPEIARERVKFFPEQTEPLHATDRVGTYGSMHFGEVQ